MPTNRADSRRKKNAGHRLNLESLESRILLSGASPTGGASPDHEKVEEAAPGRIMVGVEGPVGDFSARIDQLYPGATIQHEYDGINAALVDLPEGQSVDDGIDKMRGVSGVRYAEPDYVYHRAQTIPNDPDFDNLWGLDNTGQTGGTADADIDAPETWDITTGSSDVIVGIIDSGIDYLHQDLADNMWENPGEIPGNGIDDDQNGYVDDVYGWDFVQDDNEPTDDSIGHGTHVAGTIGAVGDNGEGVAGVNWDVQVAALKVFHESSTATSSGFAEAIEYAVDMGFDLTNNSWGGLAESQAIYDAISYANDHDQLFVAAAGNGGSDGIGDDNDVMPFFPASSDLDNIISVAATDHNDELAVFSNYGETTVDLAAPGVNIYSTLPDTYGYMSGTSMAAPHVAGSVALLKGYNPALSGGEVKTAIMDTVDELGSLEGKMVTGGRLNLYNALASVPAPIEGVDISVQSLAVDSASLYGSTTLSGDYTVLNQGDTGFEGDFDIELYFSDDDSVGGGDDHLQETFTVTGGLASFEKFTHSFSLTDVPSADPFGTDGDYYLVLAVDTPVDGANGQIEEVNEDNNTANLQLEWHRGAAFEDDFSTDKGWTGYAPGGWERGPAEAGTTFYGYPDPNMDTTPTADNYILGYNIGGNYSNNIPETLWITSPVIDLSDVTDTELQFQRWLNVEWPFFDEASIEVYDGEDWVRIAENPTQVTDSNWVPMSYDISSYADDNSEFQLRFGMGPTDGSVRFSGWNIDDLRVVGDLPMETTPPRVSSVEISPGRKGAPTTMRLNFNEGMALYPLEDESNYTLQNGSGSILQVDAGSDYVDIAFENLAAGTNYTLTAISGGLVDNSGNALDGDENGTAGGDFIHTFALPGLYAGTMEMYGGSLTFYDTDAEGSDDIDVRPVANVRGTAARGISQVTLTPQYSPFGLVIEQQAGSAQSIGISDQTHKAFPLTYIVANGNVSNVSLRSELTGLNLNGMHLGEDVNMPRDADEDGSTEDDTGLFATGDLGQIQSNSPVKGDVVVGGSLRSAAFGGPHSVVDGDVSVKGDLSSFALNGSGLNGNLRVKGALTRLDARSSINGSLEAGSIANARLLGPSGITGDVKSTTGDIKFIGSVDPITTPIVAENGHIHRIVARQGIESSAYIEAGKGIGSIYSRGNINSNIRVTGDLDRLTIVQGDLAGALIVNGGDVGQILIRGGSIAQDDAGTHGINVVDGDIDLLRISNPAGDAIADEVFVGDQLERLYLTGDVSAAVTVGDGEDGDRLGTMVLRGGLQEGVTVDGDLGRLAVVGGQVTEEINVSGNAGKMQFVGFRGGGASITDDISVGDHLDYFLVNGSGSTGSLTADSMGTVIYQTAAGVQGNVHADTDLEMLQSFGSLNGTVSAMDRAGTILIAGDLTEQGVINVGDGEAGDRLSQLTVRGDFLGSAITDGDLSRVSIGGRMGKSGSANPALIDVAYGDVDQLHVRGDMVNSGVLVDETLAEVFVGGNFWDSGIEAQDMRRVVVRRAISGQGTAEDKIHARSGSFDLFAGGFRYDIDGTSRDLNGVFVSAG